MDAKDPRAAAVIDFWFGSALSRFTSRPATDSLALEVAKHAVAEGFDRAMRPVERMFVYLPYEHAESLEEQLRACELTAPLEGFAETADVYRYAAAHRDIIQRFGRFPHRNAILGRASTAEEIEFLMGPGSSF